MNTNHVTSAATESKSLVCVHECVCIRHKEPAVCVYRLCWVIDHREQGKAGYCSTYTHTFIPSLHFSFPSLPSSFVPSPSLLFLLPTLFQTPLSSSSLPLLVPPAIALLSFTWSFPSSFRPLFPSYPSCCILKRQTHLELPHSLSVLLSGAYGSEEMSRVFLLLLLSFCSSSILLLKNGNRQSQRVLLQPPSPHIIYPSIESSHPSIHTAIHPSLLQQKCWLFMIAFWSCIYRCVLGLQALTDWFLIGQVTLWKFDRSKSISQIKTAQYFCAYLPCWLIKKCVFNERENTTHQCSIFK